MLMIFHHFAIFVYLSLSSEKSVEIDITVDQSDGINVEKTLIPWHKFEHAEGVGSIWIETGLMQH